MSDSIFSTLNVSIALGTAMLFGGYFYYMNYIDYTNYRSFLIIILVLSTISVIGYMRSKQAKITKKDIINFNKNLCDLKYMAGLERSDTFPELSEEDYHAMGYERFLDLAHMAECNYVSDSEMSLNDYYKPLL